MKYINELHMHLVAERRKDKGGMRLVTYRCHNCGTDKEIQKSKLKKNGQLENTKGLFCSRKCAGGWATNSTSGSDGNPAANRRCCRADEFSCRFTRTPIQSRSWPSATTTGRRGTPESR